MKKKKTLCIKGLSDKERNQDKCPQDCSEAGWNNGSCYSECLVCGGDNLVTSDGVICTSCDH